MPSVDATETETTIPPTARKLVMIDFDGTVVPWGPLMAVKDPFPGVREALWELRRRGYRIGIFTSRLSDSWLLDEFGKVAFNAVEQHDYISMILHANDIPFDFITAEKIPAEAYFDDKAWAVRETVPLPDAIQSFLEQC